MKGELAWVEGKLARGKNKTELAIKLIQLNTDREVHTFGNCRCNRIQLRTESPFLLIFFVEEEKQTPPGTLEASYLLRTPLFY